MAAVGVAMLRPVRDAGSATVRLTPGSAPRLAPRLALSGAGVGAAAGFFGIGGGFLIVPGLMTATQPSGAPLPLPMRVSAGFLQTGLSGKILIQT